MIVRHFLVLQIQVTQMDKRANKIALAAIHRITIMHGNAEGMLHSGDVPVVLTQVILLLTSSADCPTAHTVNVYRDPGRRLATVIMF